MQNVDLTQELLRALQMCDRALKICLTTPRRPIAINVVIQRG